MNYSDLEHTVLLKNIINISQKAGDAILEIYAQDFTSSIKADTSPLTEADLAAHHLIVNALHTLTPHIPILSEESTAILNTKIWREWETYWLVDPLDGTKEFIQRNGEFTVNIALIHQHKAVLGVVHVPVEGITYCGSIKTGAYKLSSSDSDLKPSQKIIVNTSPSAIPTIVASRSHPSDALVEYLKSIGEHHIITMGSSLKICLIAEGQADCYPRFGPTSEWDTAAAHAVVSAAGGLMMTTEGTELEYNTSDEILNPHFIACGSNINNWLNR